MEERNVKIVHIINGNGLFLSWIKKSFNKTGISNQFIVLNSKGTNKIDDNGNFHFDLTKKGKALALEVINNSDIAIHYFLDYPKSELILLSNKSVKHYWYFYGADVYQQLNIFRKNLYGDKTKKWMFSSLKFKFRLEFRAIKHSLFKQSRTPKQNLIKSFGRIEKLLWYIDEEVSWINEKVKTPDFYYFKFFTFQDIIPFEKGSVDVNKKNILIGNSAAIENNHLDVLTVFKNSDFKDFNVALPLSYGEPEKYKQYVKKEYAQYFGDKFSSQENTLSLDDYYNWLNGFPTAIMLHYRQQALGNIFYLIANGTKVYLSKKNILLRWFRKNNIDVFCFEEEFMNDYHQNNLTLKLEKQQSNYLNLKEMLSQESSFIDQILNDFK